MASGDLTASIPIYCEGSVAVKIAIDTLNLAAVTDFLFVLPVEGKNNVWIVFKVEREA
jgi:hypothetical protein